MSHIKKYFLLAAGILIILFSVVFFSAQKEGVDVARTLASHQHIDLKVGNTVFDMAVSDTESLRSMGLSGVAGLKNDEAMLFVFPQEGLWGFWMKDMQFSIDIVWLDKEKKVVSFEKNVSPDTFPKTFFPKTNAMYVVEFIEGTVEKNKVHIGDQFVFPQK